MMSEDVNFDYLIVSGAKYKTTLTKKYKSRKAWISPNQNQICAFISGTVIDVLIKLGQKVKKGEPILILDAMKMYNRVLMPFDGEIVRINVATSDVIPRSFVMVEVQPR
jgi:biotin carboxyl carrier protein